MGSLMAKARDWEGMRTMSARLLESDPMADHRVETARSFESAGRSDCPQIETDVHSCARRRLDDRELFCRADSLGELMRATHGLGKLPGVMSVQLSLNRELIVGTEFLHRLVRERMETSKVRRRKVGDGRRGAARQAIPRDSRGEH